MPRNLNIRLDHAVVWVADLEKTSSFLSDVVGLRRHPMEIGVSADDPTTGGMEGVFFDGGGLWLELILPTTPGPGMDILVEKGAGALIEINFLPESYDDVLLHMRDRGVWMLNMDGSPLGDDGGLIKEGIGTGDDIEHTGQRIAYWPQALTHGTSVEIFEVIPGNDAGLINIRDNMWKGQPLVGPDEPRVSHLTLYCKDLEATAAFYTDVVGLERHGRDFVLGDAAGGASGHCKGTFIDAGGIWLELIQPTGPGTVMDRLHEKGDGYLAGISMQVRDVDTYCAGVRARGVQMLDAGGAVIGNTIHGISRFGDKVARFPLDVSCGMAVEIFERGPSATTRFPG